MSSEKPLANRRILITRDRNSANGMAKQIKTYGGEALIAPVLSFEKVEQSLQNLSQAFDCDWLIFTSANGVRFFLEQLDSSLFPKLPKLAAVGKKTKDLLENYHLKVNLMPGTFTSKALGEAFQEMEPPQKILIIKGQLAKETLEQDLYGLGHHVSSLTVYRTVPNYEEKLALRKLVIASEIDVVTFTSPSSLEFFIELTDLKPLDPFFKKTITACIGPETRRHAEQKGIDSIIMPNSYTSKALVKAIANYYMGGTPCIH